MAFPIRLDAEAAAPAAAVLAWYDAHRRDLPWRARPGEPIDPYRVWLSEIMLQQTTVTAVKPYFAAFLACWPDVDLLAQAPLDAVMQQWAGLGYYSRARNLHACAQIVSERLGGKFPDTEMQLRELPGIGPYTAAAMAAIAFGRPAVVVDGNIERVVARLFAIETPLPAAKPAIKTMTGEITPLERAGDFAQAMMDLGATICTPKRPSCSLCPLQRICRGYASEQPERLPFKAARAERPVRLGAAFFVQREDGSVLVRTRPPKGLLGGMSELPGTVWETGFDPALAVAQAPMAGTYRKLDRRITHVFTHFALELDIYVAEVGGAERPPAGHRFVSGPGLDKEAFPSVMRKVIAEVRQNAAHHPMAPELALAPDAKIRQNKSIEP